jgi:hypothetical protein
LKPDFQEGVVAFKCSNEFRSAVARHRCVPNDFAFFTRFSFKRFGTLFARLTIELIQALFHGRRAQRRPENKQETKNENR